MKCLQLVANVKEDQIISAGNGKYSFFVSNRRNYTIMPIKCINSFLDLIIKVWRVFPYATEALTLIRNIFCANPPEYVCLIRDLLCVAYNDPKTLTHSIVFFSRMSNGKSYDSP